MKFKIIHIYVVDGKTRDEALEKFAQAKKRAKKTTTLKPMSSKK